MAATKAVGISRDGGFWCGRGFWRDVVEEELGAGEPGALMAATEAAARISSRFSWSVETWGGGTGGAPVKHVVDALFTFLSISRDFLQR
jgi:hypothetical protein